MVKNLCNKGVVILTNMTMVSVEKAILEDLVNSKLKVLYDEIKEILDKWKYDDIDVFLHDARDGTIEDAEDDAVCMRNLIDKRELFFRLRDQWNQE